MGIKYLYLIRHGNFKDLIENNSIPNELEKWIEKLTFYDGGLSDKGIQQAILIGNRMNFYPIDKIYCSSLPRAKETAERIAETINRKIKIEIVPELMECMPWATIEKSDQWGDGLTLADIGVHLKHANSGLTKFFVPTTSDKDEHEILVSHCNTMRYWITSLLGLETDNWIDFSINNCALSVVEIQQNGKTRLKSLNDTGHLTIDLI